MTDSKPCSKCGESKPLDEFPRDKSKKTGRAARCKACSNAASKRYYDANLERVREYQRENKRRWYGEPGNAETVAARGRAYLQQPENRAKMAKRGRVYRKANAVEISKRRRVRYRRDRDKTYQRNAEWQRRNPDKVRLYRIESVHRARAKKSGNDVFRVTQKELRRMFAAGCTVCGQMDRLEIDHVIPLARGGAHSVGNVQVLCRPHNALKSALLPIEFRLLLSAAA